MDLAIVSWFAEHHTPFLDSIMPWVTHLGDGGFIWILLTLLLLIFPKTRKIGVMCAVALLLMAFSSSLIKNLVARPRPYTHLPELVLLIPPEKSFSFPSGHTAASFAFAFSVWLNNRRWGWAALVGAMLIAFSRLYLSVHYPTDVLGGILLGALCALAARWFWGSWEIFSQQRNKGR